MAWTTPMTAVTNQVLTATQYNTFVRDNFLVTAPAQATGSGNLMITQGANSVRETPITSATVATAETTTSTTYVNLATVGPRITADCASAALVFYGGQSRHTVTTGFACMSVAVSGSTTVAASDDWRVGQGGTQVADKNSRGLMCRLFEGLTEGDNTFTMQYRIVSAGTGTFAVREIFVVPL